VMNFADIREVELGMIKTDDVKFFPILACERSAETAAGSNDYDFHSSVAALCERRPKCFRRS